MFESNKILNKGIRFMTNNLINQIAKITQSYCFPVFSCSPIWESGGSFQGDFYRGQCDSNAVSLCSIVDSVQGRVKISERSHCHGSNNSR